MGFRNKEFKRGKSLKVKFLLLLLFVGVLSILVQLFWPKDKFFLFAKVNGGWVSGMTAKDAASTLEQKYKSQKVAIENVSGVKIASFSLQDADISAEKSVKKAIDYPFWQRVIPYSSIVRLFIFVADSPEVKLDTTDLTQYVPVEPINALARFTGTSFVVEKEQAGYQYEDKSLREKLGKLELRADKETAIRLVVATVPASLTEEKITPKLAGVEAAIKDGVVFIYSGERYEIPFEKIGDMVGFRDDDGTAVATVDDFKLRQYFAGNFEDRIMVKAGYFTVDKYGLTISRGRDDDKSVDYDDLTENLEKLLASEMTGEIGVILTPYSYQYIGRTKYSMDLAGLQKELMDRFSGEAFAVRLVDLSGKNKELASLGGTFGIRGDKVWTAASTFKIFVAYSILQAVDRGEAKWTDKSANGNSLEYCFEVMIVDSNNDCARYWLDKKGFANVAREVQEIGATSTSFKLGDMRTSADDLALMLGKLYDGTFASKESCERLLGLMKRQTTRNGIPAGTDGVVADKPGWLDGLLHDAGIIYVKDGDYILVVMTDDSTWKGIAAAAKAVQGRM